MRQIAERRIKHMTGTLQCTWIQIDIEKWKNRWKERRWRLAELIISVIILIIIYTGMQCIMVSAAEEPDQQEDSVSQMLQDKLLDEIEFDDMQKMLDEIMEDHSFSVRKALINLINGDEPISKETVRSFLYSLFFSEIQNEKGLVLKLLLIILLAAVLAEFADVFGNGQVGNISFYIVYLALFMILMESFTQLGNALTQRLLGLVEFMKALSPAYFMTVTASTGAATAAVFYEGVLLLVWAIQWLLVNLFLPVINLSVLLKMVNHLSKEEMLSKMAELLDVAVSWGLKTLLGTVVGLQIVRNMVSPVIDTLKRSAIGKTASAIPGIGNAVTAVTELVLTSAVMVRNSFGVVIVILLLIIGAGPVVHYGSLSLIYRFLAALAQPVSDKRVVGALETMGEGCALLLKLLLTAEVLCMLTFLIIIAGVS